MTSLEDLRKALKNRPKFDLEWVPEVQEWFEGFEAKFSIFQKDYDKQVHVPRKQLSERVLEIDEPSNDYSKVYQQNRQYRTLLKELLEATQK